MQSYTIVDKKKFMHSLLKGDLFDSFLLREALLTTRCKIIIDGERNIDFYDPELDTDLTPYMTWKEIQPSVYQLIAGHKLPTYFKIIFATNDEKTSAISTDVSTFFLNITIKDNNLTCSTGVAYKTFSLDKSPETTWDKKIERFLLKYAFI